jgi:hypothetical protein
MVKWNEIFGNGVEGTVVSELLPEGLQCQPRGIPILVLMASLLDPKMKGGVSIPDIDKEFLFRKRKEAMITISWELDEMVREPKNSNNNDDDDDDNILPVSPQSMHMSQMI